MSSVNYTGSVADRFMRFSSSLKSVTETKTDLFNAVEVFIPAGLAEGNIQGYTGSGLTEDKPIVKRVTSDNYKEVLSGDLLAQWKDYFDDGANLDGMLYLIVFYDTGFKVTTDPKELSREGLTGPIANKAISRSFEKVFNLAYFKTIFFDKYTGENPGGEEPYTKVNKFFDMSLCLAALCEIDTKFSMFLSYYQPDLTKISYPGLNEITDENLCKVLSKTKEAEIKAAIKFDETTPDQRAENYWGFLNLIGGQRTALLVNNGVYVDPIRLGVWMRKKNPSGTYIGNKLAKIKLTAKGIKPTGLPNIIEEDVNDNLDSRLAENADAKYVAYLLSISDSSQHNSEVIDDKTVAGVPINASMIAKYIDYTCSQTLAEFVAKIQTLDRPVLVNKQTYNYIQKLVGDVINSMTSTGRLTSISLRFPPYEEAKKGNTFEGKAVWSATYVDDLAGVRISGSINF